MATGRLMQLETIFSIHVVGWGIMLQAQKVAGSIPMRSPNPSSRFMALGVDIASNRNEY
jgi:hypothetical protein